MYDYVIIGGGIAGLYTAYHLEHKYKHIRILLLEKNPYLGGRTRMVDFHSSCVVTGAGVGRYPKDRLLYALVSQSHENILLKTSAICYQFAYPVSTLAYVESLKQKKKWIKKHRSTHTFRQFFLSFFTRSEYKQFCDSNGYTDFEDADIVDTLYDYGFEDNVPGNQFFPVKWNRVIKNLSRQLKHTTILLNTAFERFRKQKDGTFKISTHDGQVFLAQKIVFAGSVEQYPYQHIKKQIGYNSFLRAYSFSHKITDPIHKKGSTTYVDNELQKVLYITPRIRMISYSDNQHAEKVMRLSDAEMMKKAGFSWDDTRRFYWKCGTHYYRPLESIYTSRDDFIRHAQNPEPGIFLVGECISRNQGWTEGALESVHAILDKL